MFNILKKITIAMLIFLTGELVGFNAMESYNREMARTEELPLEDLYQEKMVKEKTIVLKRFFPQLQKVRHAKPGDVIFTNGIDSLYFVRKDVIDNYLSYTLKDNHNNVWYLHQEGDKFILSQKGKRKNKI